MAKAASKTKEKTVLLTGITGFIAKRIMLDLLNKGYNVRGTMRSLAKQDEIYALVQTAGFNTQNVECVEADLLNDKGWQEAANGCDFAIHTASPFPLARPKNPDALVRPALGGTLRILKAAHKAGIKRVVLTSSVVAITEGRDHAQGYEFTEADWSDPKSKTIEPYPLSKTLAEQAAWDFVKNHDTLELATINPAFVMGPVLDGDLNASADLINMFINGKYPGVPDIQFGVVDVRDVSAAHIEAMTTKEAAGKRFICSAGSMTMIEIANTLRGALPEKHTQKLPKFVMPKFLLRLIAIVDPAVRSIIKSVGKRSSFNNSQARKLLGMSFIEPRESVTAMAKSLIDKKLV